MVSGDWAACKCGKEKKVQRMNAKAGRGHSFNYEMDYCHCQIKIVDGNIGLRIGNSVWGVSTYVSWFGFKGSWTCEIISGKYKHKQTPFLDKDSL